MRAAPRACEVVVDLIAGICKVDDDEVGPPSFPGSATRLVRVDMIERSAFSRRLSPGMLDG